MNETLRRRTELNYTLYECLVGMSKFDRQEMSRFIESLLYFAEMYDVDVTRYEGGSELRY